MIQGFQTIELPLADDLHVHLRQDAMMRAVTPLVRGGGVGRCLVMPNTTPPIDTVEAAVRYHDELEAIEPSIDYLMTLYLNDRVTPDVVHEAAKAGVVGIKLYPRGVTTNSAGGVADLDAYEPIFEIMQDVGLVLEIHGEEPAVAGTDICVLNAEDRFLPRVRKLHRRFPRLRIVLEHVTTASAVDTVMSLGDTVAATITVHHLDLIVDDWAGRNHNFCKPVAKFPHDRAALRYVVRDGHERFFLGSDSAPHPREAKECAEACAGVFTAPFLLAYLADSFERLDCLEHLPDFCSRFGRVFYDLPERDGTITLRRTPQTIPAEVAGVVPYRAGQTLNWSVA